MGAAAGNSHARIGLQQANSILQGDRLPKFIIERSFLTGGEAKLFGEEKQCSSFAFFGSKPVNTFPAIGLQGAYPQPNAYSCNWNQRFLNKPRGAKLSI